MQYAGLRAALRKGCSVLDCGLHGNIVRETQMFAIVDFFFVKLCTDQRPSNSELSSLYKKQGIISQKYKWAI
jgi:hypothetical protein